MCLGPEEITPQLPEGIPSLDLAEFTSGDPARKAQFVKDIGAACMEYGFIAIKNHGIADELIEAMYTEVKWFFAQEKSVKEQYHIKGIGGQRGYTAFKKEHAKGQPDKGDLKEFWHFGQYVEDDEELKAMYPPNIPVKSDSNKFDTTGKEMFRALEGTGSNILRAMALFLDLEEEHFSEYVHNGNSILRPIHYPPITEEPKGSVRAGAHEDINLITLLIGASADGLQILSKKGDWIPVTTLENHIVVNVGDMLQRYTNKIFKSTTHRVVNPPREQWGSSRFSIPFFLHPKASMKLDCLPSCVTAKNPAQFDSILAGDYLIERLKAIGLL